MKTILLIFISVLLTLPAAGQGKNNFFLHTAGVIPVGVYSNTGSKLTAGFAMPGKGAQGGYFRKLGDFRLGAQGTIFLNDFNTRAYDDYVRKLSKRISSTTHSGYAFIGANLVLGVDFKKINNIYKDFGLVISGHLKPGWGAFVSGKLENTVPVNSDTLRTVLDGYIKGSFMGMAGVEVKSQLAPHLSISGGIDYMIMRVRAPWVNLTQYQNNKEILDQNYTVETRVRNLFFYIGLAVDF